jgi:hypothetical protein
LEANSMTRVFLKATLLTLALGCSTAMAAPPSSAIAAGVTQASTLDDTDMSAQRVVRRTTVVRGPAGGVAVRRATVVRPGPVGWARPGHYYWGRGGAIAAGAAIGLVAATTAAAWAGPPPFRGACWYYTDPSRRQGFWDYCR